MEIALSKYCGPDDVITPLTGADEAVREALGYRGPQNIYLPGAGERCFYNHIPARVIRSWVGPEVWNSYYKFCFERNPWDRVISLYYWRCNREPRPGLTRFLLTDTPSVLKKKGYEVYIIDGRIAVDRVYLYEELEQSLETIARQLGLQGSLSLPRTKDAYRKDARHYREILSESEATYIGRMFADEIRLFGYSY